MMAIDQHMLWGGFFASLFGFVLLYSLRRRNCSSANKKQLKRKSFPEVCAKQSFSDGESRPLEGSGTDVIIVGAGVAGAALAYTLGKDGRRVHVIERDLTEPDRIVGELLLPGGYLKLVELGLEDCVEEIDAQWLVGYIFFKDGEHVRLPYPLEKFHSNVAGRSFHNGRFIQRMREKAATLPNVQLQQGTVTSLLEGNGTIKGVQYKTKDGQEHKAYAPLTIVCDGCFSNLRRSLCNPTVKLPSWNYLIVSVCLVQLEVDVPSCFVGLIMQNSELSFANHANVIVADPSLILFYPISSTEVRCLVDVPGQKLPSVDNGEMANYLKTVVGPQIPAEFKEAFISAVDKGNIRTMPNRSMPADPLRTPGALLMGDALNMRHPLTGGGMTVALSDIVILRDLLKPLHDLNDASSLSKYLESFYTLRKPVASTINTLADVFYKVFSSSPDQARKEMRQACFDYLSLGGIFSKGLLALLSGLNARPLNLVLHFFAVAIYGAGRLLLPFPSPKGLWIGARLISSASSIIFPIIKAEGVRQMFFPATVSAYYRAPPVMQDIQKDVAEIK
ncbi:squalene epoxidase 3-like isoform X2 [Carya illinoinensis]|uniref:squalene epoxidase 3-like isoform X2 n=1 Tax=Carya illinoinensis TaxID=32201 RepID=UPI001C7189E9|nr:squalene epoxidase 3-like isoform X2 [Carya illinoinensis]